MQKVRDPSIADDLELGSRSRTRVRREKFIDGSSRAVPSKPKANPESMARSELIARRIMLAAQALLTLVVLVLGVKQLFDMNASNYIYKALNLSLSLAVVIPMCLMIRKDHRRIKKHK